MLWPDLTFPPINLLSYPKMKTDEIKNPLDVQIGGNHYKTCAIQPIEYIEANDLGFLEGCIVKRITRHDKKTGKGKQDILKIIHECELLLRMRYENSENSNTDAEI